jgi:hypothetical protein
MYVISIVSRSGRPLGMSQLRLCFVLAETSLRCFFSDERCGTSLSMQNQTDVSPAEAARQALGFSTVRPRNCRAPDLANARACEPASGTESSSDRRCQPPRWPGRRIRSMYGHAPLRRFSAGARRRFYLWATQLSDAVPFVGSARARVSEYKRAPSQRTNGQASSSRFIHRHSSPIFAMLATLFVAAAAVLPSALAHGGVLSYSWSGQWYQGWAPYNSPTGQRSVAPVQSYEI